MADRFQIYPMSEAVHQGIEKRALNMGTAVSTARSGAGTLARRLLKSPSSAAAVGAAGGAAIGGGREALRKKEPGEGGHLLRSTLRGAGAGAALGGGLAAGAGAVRDTRLLQAAKGDKSTVAAGIKGTVGRAAKGVQQFGKRQIHGVTGKFKDSLTDGLKGKVHLEKLRIRDELKHVADPAQRKELLKQYKGTRRGLATELKSQNKAVAAGITSVPGVLKGMATSPLQTSKAMWDRGTGGGSKAGLAFGLGVPLAMAAPDLAKGDESGTGGASMKQKLVRHGGMVTTGMLTGGLPIIPGMIAQEAASKGIARASHDPGSPHAKKAE